MRRLLALLAVSLPVLSTSGSNLWADELTPLAITELLSKSYAADGRCAFLPSHEREELGRYASHAARAAMELESEGAAREAVLRGRASAEISPCSPALGQQARSALIAARRAMAAIAVPEAEEPAGHAAPAAAGQAASNLAAYEERMRAYLLELRCRHLSKRDERKFWALMVEEHRSTIDRHGDAAVGLAKVRAESQAQGHPCNSRSKELVRMHYREMAGR